MNSEKNNLAVSQIQRVTFIGIGVNVLLAVVKVAAGIVLGAFSLIADGLHSLSDLVSDFAVLLGAKVGAKSPDINHPYGHGWAETFAAVFVSLLLAGVGAFTIYRASISIANEEVSRIGSGVLVVAILSIIAKEFAYQLTKKQAVKLSSSMLYANAWHHRSDAASSFAVAVGALASIFNFEYGDQFAAVAVGLMIIYVAAKILVQSIGQFTEKSASRATQQKIAEIIAAQPGIDHWHKLRTRTVGRELFMDLHIMVDPNLNIAQAHDISNMLENAIHANFNRPVNITVHIEPADGR